MQSNNLTAIFYLSDNRFTYTTSDGLLVGHGHNDDTQQLIDALHLLTEALTSLGYEIFLKFTNLEGINQS